MRRGKSYGRRQPKKKVGWVRTLFIESALALDGTLSELVLIEPTTDVLGSTTRMNEDIMVRRIVINGGVGIVPAVTTLALDICQLNWAVYAMDLDDTDASLNSTAQTAILGNERILQCGAEVFTAIEGTGTQVASNVIPGLKINLDMRLNVRMRRDTNLYLGLQFGSAVTSAVTLAAFGGISSVLINQP